jgi:signal transduction histidine kinase
MNREVTRVLILEDDPGITALQTRILNRSGFEVEAYDSAEEARERIKQGGIDLMLLDNRLEGGVDGLEFYRQLKDDGFDLPVILVTGFSNESTIIRALRQGVLDYVTKSAEYLSYLPEAVHRALERIRTRRELQSTNAQLRQALTDLEAKTDALRDTTRQLWQAAKLASVGELAASIAHELNNPLGIISLRLEGVLAKTPADDPRRKPLEVIEQELERMARLVANVLHFSRSGKEEVSSVDLSEEIDRTLDLMHHHLKKRGIEVRQEIGPGHVRIVADRQKLRQVFLNLVSNAGDAMPGGGVLTLRVSHGPSEGGNPTVQIDVSDTGHGIPPDVLPKVMDAFFTTKEEGKGTGLGLAICRRIVQEHRGTIRLESHPGKGTTVHVILPVTSEANVAHLRAI